MRVLGVDLAGVETRPTGLCLLRNMQAETRLVFKDQEIVATAADFKPEAIAIDAPLSLPSGRTSIEERTSIHFRECDRELMRRGIRFFPVTLGPMRKLTTRGINLRRVLEHEGFKTIEVYPGGAQDILGVPRKQKGLPLLATGLRKVGIEGLKNGISDHELDAATCGLVGRLWLLRKAEAYGTGDQVIVMPKLRAKKASRKFH